MRLRNAPDLYDATAPNMPVHVYINTDLLQQARALNINLSRTLVDRLEELIRTEKRKRWLADNREAIEAYNKHIADYGVFSEGVRTF